MKNFYRLNTNDKFTVVRDMIHSSLYMKDAENEGLFVNIGDDRIDEMGNILDLYDMLKNKKI